MMGISDYLKFLKSIIASVPFNIFDYIVFVIFAIYVFEDASFGIVQAGISLASTLSGFFIGLIFYPQISRALIAYFSLTKGISDALSFLLLAGISFMVISAILSIVRKRYISITFPKKVDFIGGGIFGALSFFFIASFAVALLLSFPVSEPIKDSVKNSVSGKFLFSNTQGIEVQVKRIFGGAIEETINFLTVKPGSNQVVTLNFTVSNPKADEKSEAQMLLDLNAERSKAGFSGLSIDERLRDVARSHAKDMLERGYFSHYTPEGLSPFDRLTMANITYQFAGENLAFAPDEQIAMDGLMKSQGHRENILSPNYGKVGIGVIDAGIFGKMFVQEFTD